MSGACLAVDGYFQRTKWPTKCKVANQLAYYSGHYESYGVNCQAAVKSNLNFLYFGVVAPGSTNDRISFPTAAKLVHAINGLPQGLYADMDVTYELCEKSLTLFTGVEQMEISKDAFNYYLSELRICVEISFGCLV